mgnify:CR=1 FL=1
MGNARHAALHRDHEHLHGLRRTIHPLLCADHPAGTVRAGYLHAQSAELSHAHGNLAVRRLERGDHDGGATHRRDAWVLRDRAGSPAGRQCKKIDPNAVSAEEHFSGKTVPSLA